MKTILHFPLGASSHPLPKATVPLAFGAPEAYRDRGSPEPVMRLSQAQEIVLFAACNGRLCISGRDAWVDGNTTADVDLATIDWLEHAGLIAVDWDAALWAAALRWPAHRPVLTAAGRSECQD